MDHQLDSAKSLGSKTGLAFSMAAKQAAHAQLQAKPETTINSAVEAAASLAHHVRETEEHARRIIDRLIGGAPASGVQDVAKAQMPQPVEPHAVALNARLSTIDRGLCAINAHLNRLADSVGVDRS